jgi:hypothetical protein
MTLLSRGRASAEALSQQAVQFATAPGPGAREQLAVQDAAAAQAQAAVRSFLRSQTEEAMAVPAVCNTLTVYGTPESQWLNTLQSMPAQLLDELVTAVVQLVHANSGLGPTDPNITMVNERETVSTAACAFDAPLAALTVQ